MILRGLIRFGWGLLYLSLLLKKSSVFVIIELLLEEYIMKDVDRILDGENVRNVLLDGPEYDYTEDDEELFEMASLHKVDADLSRTGEMPEIIYLSSNNSSHGPRLKFQGGPGMKNTKDFPSYAFGVNGPIGLVYKELLDKKRNVYTQDLDYMNMVRDFIQRHLVLLLLVWFHKLPDSVLLYYFNGSYSFEKMLSRTDIPEDKKEKVLQCKDEKELYKVCKELDLFKFH